MSRGQSLVELAVCAPIVLLLTVGVTAGVQAFDARAGLDAATQAAAAEAARAPDPTSAERQAQARFASMIAAYPLSSAHLNISVGKFSRTDQVMAIGTATVDISWAALVFPRSLTLQSQCTVPVESWRSRRQ